MVVIIALRYVCSKSLMLCKFCFTFQLSGCSLKPQRLFDTGKMLETLVKCNISYPHTKFGTDVYLWPRGTPQMKFKMVATGVLLLRFKALTLYFNFYITVNFPHY